MRRRVAARGLALLALAAGCRRDGAPPPSDPSKLAKATLPDFARPTLAGPLIDTKALRGKVVVIKFFARFCKPCRYTLPEAEALHQRLGSEVVVIGIAEDEDRREVEALAREYGLTFPLVHDVGHVLAGRYRVTEIPIAFVADREGTVRWVGGPGMRPGQLERAIESLR